MKAQMTRTECPIKINEGDVIRFTNNRNYPVEIPVTRVEEKSWYAKGGRNSFGTLVDYKKSFSDFRINEK